MKLHKVITVFKYVQASWANSKELCLSILPDKCRFLIFLDLIRCYLLWGDDFNDYRTFEFWNKTTDERKSYISFRRNDKLRFAFTSPDVYQVFLDKATFNQRFAKYIHRAWVSTTKHSRQTIDIFLHTHDVCVAKPLTDYGGHGILKLDRYSPEYSSSEQTLRKRISAGEDFIIEECISNSSSIREIANNSLNTVRVVTVLDQRQELHVVAALLRFGNGKGFTDNYHDGGMACPINLSTGQLTKFAYGMNNVKYERHPSSHVVFEGFPIPEFQDCMKLITSLVWEEPSARYVGWDIAITDNGLELLEGNIPPGEDITQIATGKGIWYQMLEWK